MWVLLLGEPASFQSSREACHLPQGDSSRIDGPGDIKRKLIKNSSLSSNCLIKSTELE